MALELTDRQLEALVCGIVHGNVFTRYGGRPSRSMGGAARRMLDELERRNFGYLETRKGSWRQITTRGYDAVKVNLARIPRYEIEVGGADYQAVVREKLPKLRAAREKLEQKREAARLKDVEVRRDIAARRAAKTREELPGRVKQVVDELHLGSVIDVDAIDVEKLVELVDRIQNIHV